MDTYILSSENRSSLTVLFTAVVICKQDFLGACAVRSGYFDWIAVAVLQERSAGKAGIYVDRQIARVIDIARIEKGFGPDVADSAYGKSAWNCRSEGLVVDRPHSLQIGLDCIENGLYVNRHTDYIIKTAVKFTESGTIAAGVKDVGR